MRGRKTRVSVLERTEGDTNPAGETIEAWNIVAGGSGIDVHIRPLSVAKATALNQTNSGQVFTNNLMIIFEPGFDIDVDDRLMDSKENEYVIQHVAKYHTHTEAVAGVTNQQ